MYYFGTPTIKLFLFPSHFHVKIKKNCGTNKIIQTNIFGMDVVKTAIAAAARGTSVAALTWFRPSSSSSHSSSSTSCTTSARSLLSSSRLVGHTKVMAPQPKHIDSGAPYKQILFIKITVEKEREVGSIIVSSTLYFVVMGCTIN